MSTTITFRRGTAAPTSGAGLTLGEPAFDTTNRNLYMGLGHGVTAAWIGARISGSSADIAAGLTSWIVNAKAIRDYIDTAAISGVTAFSSDISVNSLTIGRGGNDVGSNTALGTLALYYNDTGNNNTGVGYYSLQANEDGYYLTSLGSAAFRSVNGGTASVAIGSDAGRYYGSLSNPLTAVSNSVYVGHDSRAGADDVNNEIVIGASAVGQGSNSTTIGTSATTLTRLFGVISTNGGLSAAGATFSGNVLVGATLTVNGNFIVQGTTTTINSTTISVDDKNIVLGGISGADDTTAQGGGITLKGTGDKTLYWTSNLVTETQAPYAWNTNQNFNLDSSGYYAINGAIVLSGATLGAGVLSSSLTKVGTITEGTWNSDITYVDGGTYT